MGVRMTWENSLIANDHARGFRADLRPVRWRPIERSKGILESAHEVAQFAGEGEELESFADSLIDPLSAGAVNAGGDAVADTRFANMLDRVHKLRVVAFE